MLKIVITLTSFFFLFTRFPEKKITTKKHPTEDSGGNNRETKDSEKIAGGEIEYPRRASIPKRQKEHHHTRTEEEELAAKLHLLDQWQREG